MSENYYDEDGFLLEFEEDTSDAEKQFYLRAFPNVNKIAERKVHCSSCYCHIGTAPISEAVIRMHPVLKVTHCRNCHTFYNSGEFDKGEDGSELYCRWCGQGGEVYCCSKCPYVFCKKCILQNLSRACVQDIARNENWNCFNCAPKIMWHLRAQHWALSNFIEKQKKEMNKKNLTVAEINALMKKDATTCCVKKDKKLPIKKPDKTYNKRPSTGTPTDNSTNNEITGGHFLLGGGTISRKATGTANIPDLVSSTPPPAKKKKGNNDEVVCTPDIMSMFMSPDEPPPLRQLPAATPTTPVTPAAVARPVVVQRPVPTGVPMLVPTTPNSPITPPTPVYHTINGYRIDLHTAAQQGTYRLPNGKLIQVRKQMPNTPAAQPAPPLAPQRNTTLQIRQPGTTNIYGLQNGQLVQRVTNGSSNVQISLNLQQQQMAQQQIQIQQQQQQQRQQQMQQQQQQQQQQHQAQQPGQMPPLVLLQNLVNAKHPDTPLGAAQKEFEMKLLSGAEICHHIVGKINTLTNSNSFKTIRNVHDLKELYIHVSYLLTYAMGRFKTLQEKCVDDVKKMGFTKDSDFVMMGMAKATDAKEDDKSDEEDDDCEIVEQKTTLIEIDSDDEDAGAKSQGENKTPKKTTEQDTPNDAEKTSSDVDADKNKDETEIHVELVSDKQGTDDTEVEPIPMDPTELLAVSLNSSGEEQNDTTKQSDSEANDAEENIEAYKLVEICDGEQKDENDEGKTNDVEMITDENDGELKDGEAENESDKVVAESSEDKSEKNSENDEEDKSEKIDESEDKTEKADEDEDKAEMIVVESSEKEEAEKADVSEDKEGKSTEGKDKSEKEVETKEDESQKSPESEEKSDENKIEEMEDEDKEKEESKEEENKSQDAEKELENVEMAEEAEKADKQADDVDAAQDKSDENVESVDAAKEEEEEKEEQADDNNEDSDEKINEIEEKTESEKIDETDSNDKIQSEESSDVINTEMESKENDETEEINEETSEEKMETDEQSNEAQEDELTEMPSDEKEDKKEIDEEEKEENLLEENKDDEISENNEKENKEENINSPLSPSKADENVLENDENSTQENSNDKAEDNETEIVPNLDEILQATAEQAQTEDSTFMDVDLDQQLEKSLAEAMQTTSQTDVEVTKTDDFLNGNHVIDELLNANDENMEPEIITKSLDELENIDSPEQYF
uniref:Putative retinitis pigmentosa gtpase regulator b n=1 Tax=Corethrella appendiculata TaxID=1370023 RepID=U5EU04_9DIPT